MAFNGSDRGGLLSAGGILSIIAGVIGLGVGLLFVASESWWLMGMTPFHPAYSFMSLYMGFVGIWLVAEETGAWALVGSVLALVSVVAIMGGISAIKRESFGLSAAGAICGLPSGIFGVLAIIFVALARREFE